MLSGVGTLAGALVVLYAAHKGSDTYKQWRRQKSEERRIDLAEQVLTLAYKLKRAIEAIRSPLMLGGELARAENDLRERKVIDDSTPEPRVRNLRTAQGMVFRMEFYRQQWDELVDIMPVAKAVFGDRVEEQLHALWRQQRDIALAVEFFADMPTDGPATATKDHAEELKGYRKTMWSQGKAENDAVKVSVDAAVTALEGLLLPTIRSDTPFGTPN
ncbi:MAG: hypothetical protein HYU58_07225 [Proteobacteria bacterium]|nr:hypothetical protein [Pseudomonadota bacterium]